MNYPQKLEKHQIEKFNESFVLNLAEGQLLKTYIHVFHDEKYIIPMHSHNYYEINIITSGKGMHYIGNNICAATEGNAYVIPPNMSHGYYGDEPFDVFHLILSNNFLRKHAGELYGLTGYSYIFEIEPLLRYDSNVNYLPLLNGKIFNHVKNICSRLLYYDDPNENYGGSEFSPNKTISQSTLALNLISELCTVAADTSEIYPKKHVNFNENIYPIAKTMMYMSEHFSEKISFHKLAEDSEMSYSTFYRNFLKINKVSPEQFLKQLRIKNSIQLLSFTDMSIAKIAQECGFYDSAHFIRQFTSEKHISPGDYRLLMQKHN